MMISPEGYIESLKDKTYEELIKEREKLLKYIRKFENGKIPEAEYFTNPDPEVKYQVNLLYLGKLCELISRKYNLEFIIK